MIDQEQLTADLRRLLEKDLLPAMKTRASVEADLDEALKAEHKAAKDAGRTAQAFEVWRDDYLTQVGVAWVLGCVFVRFMEDNGLVDSKDNFPRIAGPGAALRQAQDQYSAYIASHKASTDRDYLLSVFTDVGTLRGCHELFNEKHNPLWAHDGRLMDADAATRLIRYFQQRRTESEQAELLHDFTDPMLGTRFLGDLYQNLSEAARKKYALLQTPIFVEEFILDRTLEPAVREFGLCDAAGRELAAQGQPIPSDHLTRVIDPTVGSGHFLLGAFQRLMAHWIKQEPMTERSVLAERSLNAIFGVDLNPYAASIAYFRLLVAALKTTGERRLKSARDYHVNIAVGDSLLHGAFVGTQGTGELFERRIKNETGLQHATSAEDLATLRRFLRPHHYHVVIGNPPYITVKDPSISEQYRDRYKSCHRKYALSVPFFERFFDLAIAPQSPDVSKAGFVGKITANSFMKREFGKKLIETFLPRWDLTHVIDTAGAYIPGHGTPTVILFGRHRSPLSKTIRAVLGIRGEPSTPEDPATAKVWSSILDQIDRPESESEFVSVSDAPRENFEKHPWSIGGGGAAELKEILDDAAADVLDAFVDSVGPSAILGEDDAFGTPPNSPRARAIPAGQCRTLIDGDFVRDWSLDGNLVLLFPYDEAIRLVSREKVERWLWPVRTLLAARLDFSKKTYAQCGRPWWEYHQIPRARNITPLSIVFADVATHNHFVLDRGGKLFNRHAPLIKLPRTSGDDDHYALLGLLNSAAACFWMKQVFHNKGSTVDQHGARQRTMPFEDFYDLDGTKLRQFPVPWAVEENDSQLRPAIIALARKLDTLARARADLLPKSLLTSKSQTVARAELDAAKSKADGLLQQMIAKQEDLDWLNYRAYGLLGDTYAECSDSPTINLGERAFEIVMARRMEAGTLQTEWFRRHRSTPITQIPSHWPVEYKTVVEHRIKLIETNKDTTLIEQPEFKRRWNTEKWAEMEERALREWLLDRLEWGMKSPSANAPDGNRSGVWDERDPRLLPSRRAADQLRGDESFRSIAALYAKSHSGLDDLTTLVTKLVEDESVPFLPVLRYKDTGLRNRAIWERTWELQREEDRLDSLREKARAKIEVAEQAIVSRSLVKEHQAVESLAEKLNGSRAKLLAEFLTGVEIDGSIQPEKLATKLRRTRDPACGEIVDDINATARRLADAQTDFNRELTRMTQDDDAWNQASAELDAVPANPAIEAPPRYASKDFLPGPYWMLRGKLDVPNERFVAFPHCGPEGDSIPVITWAGFDYRQQAKAITTYYADRRANSGWDKTRFIPLLAGLLELLPWLKQWHNEPDADGHSWAEVIGAFVDDEARELGITIDEIRAWKPPEKSKGKQGKKKKVEAEAVPE